MSDESSEASAPGGLAPTTADARGLDGIPAMEITSGKHRIYVHCPHIEGGACGPCVAAGVMPYIAARETLDVLLPKLALLADSLEEIAHATRKLKTWTVRQSKAKWEVADDPRAVAVQPEATPPVATEAPPAGLLKTPTEREP